ncbi:MAG: MATE family efflux transporter [Saccharofermentanales bacterium]
MKRIQLFTRRLTANPNIREIGSFALPLFAEQTSIAMTAVISTMLVSRVSSSAVSGVSLVESLNFLFQQIFLSIEIGATVVIAQYCGRNDSKSASETSVQAMLTSLGIALLISTTMLIIPDVILGFVLGKAEPAVYQAARIYFLFAVISFPFLSIYAITAASLRGSGNPRLSLISVFITNASFILCGLFFVNGLKMGVAGVGLALVMARLSGAMTGLFLLKMKSNNLHIERWIPKKIDWHIQKSILLIGVPSCIENLIFQTGRLTTQTFTIMMGTSSIATNALSNSICGFYNIPGNTAAAIAVPIVGKYLGMRNKKDAWQSSKIILILSTLTLSLLSLVLFIFIRPVAGLFTADKGIIDGIAFISRTNFIVTPVIWTLSFVAPAVLRASGDMKFTTMVSIFSMVVFRMTIGYFLAITMGLGVIGIWIGMYVDWAVRGILFGIRYYRRRWTDRILIRERESSC